MAIPAVLRDGLRRDGPDIGEARPVKIAPADLQNAAQVTRFGPDLKEFLPTAVKASDRSATPALSKSDQAARAYILNNQRR